jgi:hypothetical protein
LKEEPILAIVPYLNLELRTGDIMLVYDFGGGTFDTAVVRVDVAGSDNKPHITVLSADGEPFCGGTDIDDAFSDYMIKRIAKESGNKDLVPSDSLKKMITKQVEDLKIILSEQKEANFVTPITFPKIPGFEVKVTREEFENMLSTMILPDKTRLFDKTMGCILRTWRKARMVYRKDNEVSGGYYLKINLETGETSKYITQLDFQDMKENINHILLIGGTTKIPIIKDKLSKALGGISFIPEKGPYEPVTACSLGAASQLQHIETIIDRLPFSMSIRQGDEIQELYQAFTSTSLYQPSIDTKIKPFRSKSCLIEDENNAVTFEYTAPDGTIFSKQRCQSIVPGKYVLEINCYGQISLVHDSGVIREEFENPAQHELQKERWKSVLDEEERKKQIDANRARKLRERYFDDHNTDVG